jgi:hypothetical protein
MRIATPAPDDLTDAASASIQDRAPNFRENGRLYLVRCFACDSVGGTENYLPAVASGCCAWCGWCQPKTAEDESK